MGSLAAPGIPSLAARLEKGRFSWQVVWPIWQGRALGMENQWNLSEQKLIHFQMGAGRVSPGSQNNKNHGPKSTWGERSSWPREKAQGQWTQ